MKKLYAVAAVSAAAAVLVAAGPPASAEPPPPPGEATARSHLADLTVRAEGSMTGYDREKFPHWSDQGGGCSTREKVLQRDGQNVTVGSDCYPTGGSWTSPYDGATWKQPSDIDIDHMVALAEAWRSGASSWTTSRREAFANDLDSSQLWAVTDNVNQSKGDQDPAEWTPPSAGFHCMYARSWIDVKWRYGLTVDSAERGALEGLLGTC
ncbi:DUF1524 domain-containing protein [Actinomadura sp. CNU-125]|uniref:GmrSD restriction endonuclease domain-containing protein n=1 Tax=Actinomadura sp. CNU-125 TaxID=1904961 RepID=UPI000AAA31FD|nr:DUF1524 domain-containing protein [Actinomadura sp. CNU-125]